MSPFRAVLAAVAALAGPAVPAVGQENGQRFRDWTVIGLGTADCALAQRVVTPDGGLFVADLFLQPLDAGGAVLSVRVPVGASIRDPIAYRDGNGAVTDLTWQSCDAETCLAQAVLEAGDRAALEAGREIRVGFVPTRTSRPLSFAVSLMGVTRGLEAVRACRG